VPLLWRSAQFLQCGSPPVPAVLYLVSMLLPSVQLLQSWYTSFVLELWNGLTLAMFTSLHGVEGKKLHPMLVGVSDVIHPICGLR
jgi:hypothetical protein